MRMGMGMGLSRRTNSLGGGGEGGGGSSSAPVIDLNGAGGGINASGTFTEGDGAIAFLTSATVTDADDTDLASIAIVGTNGFGEDVANDIVSWGAVTFPSNADKTADVTAGSTTISVAFTTATKTFSCTKSGGGVIPIADAQTFIRAFAYNNTATPPDTSDRVFTFVANDGTDNSTAAVLTVTVEAAGTTAPSLTDPNTRYTAPTLTIAPIAVPNSGSNGTWSVDTSSTTSLATLEAMGFTLNTSSDGTDVLSATIDAGATPGVYPVTLKCENSAGSDTATFNIDIRSAYTDIDSGDTFPLLLNSANRLYRVTEDISADGVVLYVEGAGIVIDTLGNNVTSGQVTQPTVLGGDFTNAAHWNYAGDFAHNSSATFIPPETWPDTSTDCCTITLPTASADVSMTATNDVSLVSGEWYVLKAHFVCYKLGGFVSPSMTLYVELDDGVNVHRIEQVGTQNNSGTALRYVRFKCLATGAYTLRIGVENGDGEAANELHVSNLQVIHTGRPAIVFGVESFRGEQYWPELHNIGTFGTSSACVLTTSVAGSVITAGPCFQSHAVENWDGTTTSILGVAGVVDSLRLVAQGPQSRPINSSSDTLETATVKDVSVAMHGTDIHSRHAFDGSTAGVLWNGTFTRIKIESTLQQGVSVYPGSTVDGVTTANTISTRYSNDFMINQYQQSGGGTSDFKNNVIDLSAGQGRGIYIRQANPSSGTSYIRNNIIHAREIGYNQEYGGVEASGAFGIQVEQADDLEVTDNDVTVSGVGGGACFRLNPDILVANNGPLAVTGNTFTATAESGGSAAMCCRIAEFVAAEVTFSGNTLSSNYRWIVNEFASVLPDGFVIDSCHFVKTTTSGVTFHPWQIYQGATIIDWVILDPTFEDAGSESAMDEAVLDWAGTGVDESSSYSVEHTATFTIEDGGTPQASEAITIYDAAGNSVSSGTANGSGVYTAQLKEYSYAGSTRTAHTPHRMVTSSSYHTVDLAWDNKTLTLDFTHGEPNLVAPGPYSWAKNDVISESLTNNGATGTFSLSSGSFPAGLSMDASGNLTGTVTGTGSYAPVVRCTGTYGYSEVTLDITVTGTVFDIDATKDTHVRGGVNAANNYGTLTELEFRNVASPLDNCRKGIVAFDLTTIPSCSGATLTFEQTQASTDASTYAFYGINEADDSAWAQNTVTWTTCPGHDTATNGVDVTKTTSLGSVVIGANAPIGTVMSLSTSALASFLASRVGDSQVSILIIETSTTSTLKKWAATEHATAAAPHLEINE